MTSTEFSRSAGSPSDGHHEHAAHHLGPHLAQAPNLADRISGFSLSFVTKQVFGVTPSPPSIPLNISSPARAASANKAIVASRARSASATRAGAATSLEFRDLIGGQGSATFRNLATNLTFTTPRRGSQGTLSSFLSERSSAARARELKLPGVTPVPSSDRAHPFNGAVSTGTRMRSNSPQATRTQNLAKEDLISISLHELSARKQTRELRHIGLQMESEAHKAAKR